MLFRNQTQASVEFVSLSLQRADGSYYWAGDINDVLEPGKTYIRGYPGDGDDQPFGSEIRGAVLTYKHPEQVKFLRNKYIFSRRLRR